jgi:hypothetical protein
MTVHKGKREKQIGDILDPLKFENKGNAVLPKYREQLKSERMSRFRRLRKK